MDHDARALPPGRGDPGGPAPARPWLVYVDGDLFGDYPTQEQQIAALPEAIGSGGAVTTCHWDRDGDHGPGWTEPEPATGEWRSSREAIRAATRYRCAVVWYSGGRWWPPVIHCDHKHKPPATAQVCARREAARRNRRLRPPPAQGNLPAREFDKRLPREEAEALVRRRIDAGALRYRKEAFGLGEQDKLAGHVELVHIVTTEQSLHGGSPYRVHRWGVKANGRPAGYISSNYEGTRHKFLPYGYSGDEVTG